MVTLVSISPRHQLRERRHRPTLWKLWGIPLAINRGDTILAIGMFDALAPAGCGDARFEGRLDGSTSRYMEMFRLKTSAPLSCATQIGASLGSDDRDLVALLAGYGLRLGLAFQLCGDPLDVWATTGELGKGQMGEPRRMKVTLSVVCAMERATGADRRWLPHFCAKREPVIDQQLASMLESLKRTEDPPGENGVVIPSR